MSSVTPHVMEGLTLSCLLDEGGVVLLLEILQLPQLQRFKAVTLHHLWPTCNIAPQISFHPLVPLAQCTRCCPFRGEGQMNVERWTVRLNNISVNLEV